MTDYDDDLIDELIAESKEHLETIEPDLLNLEGNPETVDPEAINRIFRAVHSIKGGFSFFSLNHIKDLAHTMENVMGLIREGELKVKSETVDALLSGTDKLRVLIDDVRASEEISIDVEVSQLETILNSRKEDESDAEKEDVGKAVEKNGTLVAEGENDLLIPDYSEAMKLLQTPGSGKLPEDVSNRLGELLTSLSVLASMGEGAAQAEEILSDYDACNGSVGLDGLVGEAIAGKLKKMGSQLSIQVPTEAVVIVDAPEVPDPVKANGDSSGGMNPTSKLKSISDEHANANANEDKQEFAQEKESPLDSGNEKSQKVSSGPVREQASTQSLRVKVDLLDNLMNLAGELVLSRNRIKRSLEDKLSSGLGTSPQLGRFKKQLKASRKRLSVLKRDSSNNLASELTVAVEKEFDAIDASLCQFLSSRFSELPALSGAVQDIDGVTSELQSGIMGTRMQLVGSVFYKFPRIIRDLNRKLGKEIELSIQGENVALDKSIIEALGDPLTHLIRNSADHGIELPATRKAGGKPVQGKIELIARHETGQVFIEIIDDGAGIDPEKI